MSPNTPRDPKEGRLAAMVTAMRASLAVLGVACLVVLVIPEERRGTASAVLVGVVVALPLLRVAWLGLRWARKGDWRFAGAAGALLAVVVLAAVLR